MFSRPEPAFSPEMLSRRPLPKCFARGPDPAVEHLIAARSIPQFSAVSQHLDDVVDGEVGLEVVVRPPPPVVPVLV